MRSEGAAEDVVGRTHVCDPVAKGLVDGFLESLLSGFDTADFGPEEPHANDVETLALHVDGAHVNDTLHPESGRDGGGGDTMLPGPGLGNDAFFTETFRENDLAESIIDLVRAGVEEVFALQVDAGTTEHFRPAFRKVKGSFPSAKFGEEAIELFLKDRISLGAVVFLGQRVEGRDEGLGNESTAEGAEMSARVGKGLRRCGCAHQ